MERWKRFQLNQQSNFRAELAEFQKKIQTRQKKLAKVMRFNLDKKADREHGDTKKAERRKAAYENSQHKNRDVERESLIKGRENQSEAYGYVQNSATKLEARVNKMAELRQQQKKARLNAKKRFSKSLEGFNRSKYFGYHPLDRNTLSRRDSLESIGNVS